MNQEQIDFLRQVVREVRAALANQSMDTSLYVQIQPWPTTTADDIKVLKFTKK